MYGDRSTVIWTWSRGVSTGFLIVNVTSGDNRCPVPRSPGEGAHQSTVNASGPSTLGASTRRSVSGPLRYAVGEILIYCLLICMQECDLQGFSDCTLVRSQAGIVFRVRRARIFRGLARAATSYFIQPRCTSKTRATSDISGNSKTAGSLSATFVSS